jgi:hypothetical protein
VLNVERENQGDPQQTRSNDSQTCRRALLYISVVAEDPIGHNCHNLYKMFLPKMTVKIRRRR